MPISLCLTSTETSWVFDILLYVLLLFKNSNQIKIIPFKFDYVPASTMVEQKPLLFL